MSRTLEFKRKVFNKVGNEYTVLGEYKNNKTKILIRHNCNLCNNHEYYVIPNNFLCNGTRCPKCNELKGKRNTRYTHDEFLQIIKNLVNDEYTVLSSYKNNKTKVKFIHNSNKCNFHQFEMTPQAFINQGQRCPMCSKMMRVKKQAKTHEEFLKDFYKIHSKNEYEVIGRYVNAHTPIDILHKKCNKISKSSPNNLLNGSKCVYCKYEKLKSEMSKTNETFLNEVYINVGNEYTVIGEYVNAHTKILIKHNECGHKYYVKPSKFLSGRRCPKCKYSKGEEKIYKYLKNNKIKFKSQYTFEDCRNKYLLPFDFAILDKYGNVKILIEYQGEQHYKPIDYFGGRRGFEYRIKNDNIKRDYCKINKIKLLEIPYWKFDNIENILSKYLGGDANDI